MARLATAAFFEQTYRVETVRDNLKGSRRAAEVGGRAERWNDVRGCRSAKDILPDLCCGFQESMRALKRNCACDAI